MYGRHDLSNSSTFRFQIQLSINRTYCVSIVCSRKRGEEKKVGKSKKLPGFVVVKRMITYDVHKNTWHGPISFHLWGKRRARSMACSPSCVSPNSSKFLIRGAPLCNARIDGRIHHRSKISQSDLSLSLCFDLSTKTNWPLSSLREKSKKKKKEVLTR